MLKYSLIILVLFLGACSRDIPKAQLSTDAQTAYEVSGSASVQVNLSSNSAFAVRVPYTLSGDALGGGTPSDDYLGANGTLIIPIGSTSGTIQFPLIDHGSTPIPDRTLIVTLGQPENAELGSTQAQTVTITNAAPPAPPATTVTASFAGATAPTPGCGAATDVVPIPFSLNFGETAPSNLVFPLIVQTTGPIVQGTHFSVTVPPFPGSSTPTDVSVNDLTITSGGSGILAEIAVDCSIIGSGATITLTVTAPSGAVLGTDPTITVSF
jgi:hypothetical protein